MQPGPRAHTLPDLQALERQLRWLRAYALVTYPFACVPFLFLFFAEHGVDAASYGEVLTAYYLTMFVAEVPTGVLADRFGRKRMLVLGPLLLAAGFTTMVAVPCHAGFILAEVLLGLGHAVLSGPPTVVLYETLRRHGQEHRYLAEEARIHARRLYGTGTAFLLGGVLVRLCNDTGTAYVPAIMATALLSLVAAVLATGIDPPRHTPPVLAPQAFLADAAREMRTTAVWWLLLYWVVLFSLLRFPFHNYQPYLQAAGEIEPWFADAVVVGGLFALLNLVAAPLSALVPHLVARLGRRVLFWSMPLMLSASMLVMAAERQLAAVGDSSRALCWLGVAMFLVQQVPFAMHWSLLHEFANHRIGSAARTTVLSVLSLGARVVYALVNVLLFHLQGSHGMATALSTAAVGGVLATALVMLLRPQGLLTGRAPVA